MWNVNLTGTHVEPDKECTLAVVARKEMKEFVEVIFGN